MYRNIRTTCLLGLVLSVSTACLAQLQYGNLKVSGTGNLTAGYNAASGDAILSNHGFQLGGGSSIDGSYYDPRFFSFSLRPYYNQSRTNSSSDSIWDSTGVNVTTQLFGGSHFPGSIGFSDYNNQRSTFGIANGPELTSNGSGRGYNVAWSELVPGFPTFTAAYTVGSGSASISGADQETTNDSHTLNLRSTYTLAGFRLNGQYQRNRVETTTPGFLVGAQEINSSGNSDSLSLQISHKFPLHGNVYGDVARSHFQNFFNGTDEGKTTADTFNGGVFLVPSTRTSISFNGTYSDSLFANFTQAITQTGVAPLVPLGQDSHSYSVSGSGSYAILVNNLYASATVTHVGQVYWNQSHDATFFSGALYGNYQRPLLGFLHWSVGVIDTASQEGNSNVGLNTSVSATHRLSHYWEVGGDFNYQQNVQTLLVGYTESSLRWAGRINRRANHWYWSAGVGGSHSVLTMQSGDGNHSQNVFSTVGNGRYSVNCNYSQAAGTSVLTSNGLQSVTIGPLIAPIQSLVLFNARSWGFSANATPRRPLSIYVSYSNALSETASTGASSNNSTGLLSANITYHARRLGFVAGMSHFSQSIGALGVIPANVNSYYVGVNRWFSFF